MQYEFIDMSCYIIRAKCNWCLVNKRWHLYQRVNLVWSPFREGTGEGIYQTTLSLLMQRSWFKQTTSEPTTSDAESIRPFQKVANSLNSLLILGSISSFWYVMNVKLINFKNVVSMQVKSIFYTCFWHLNFIQG